MDYSYESYDYYSDEERVGEKIKDAFGDLWERYADEDAVDSWFEETSDAAEEMQTRHDDENVAFMEQVGK